MNKLDCGVVNLQTSTESGSHWVAWYNDPESEDCEAFDSFGIAPHKTLLGYLKQSHKPIVYNSTELQSMDSNAYVFYCIHYIEERAKGKTPYDILYEFKQQGVKSNDEILT